LFKKTGMKEFMFYIKNPGDSKTMLPATEHLTFVKECEAYIEKLKNNNQLISAQPIPRENLVISKSNGTWLMAQPDMENEIHVGYYHILAHTIDDAVEIAKENPEFKYVTSAKIEIHPIKTKEPETGFVYPTPK